MAVPDRAAREERCGWRTDRGLAGQIRDRGDIAAARRRRQQRARAEGHRGHLRSPGWQPVSGERALGGNGKALSSTHQTREAGPAMVRPLSYAWTASIDARSVL